MTSALGEAVEIIKVGDSDTLQSLLTNDITDELLTVGIGPSQDTCTMEVTLLSAHLHTESLCAAGSEDESDTVSQHNCFSCGLSWHA